MDYQRPDPDYEDPSGARIEDDFVRPVKPTMGASRRRLPAALPFAIAGLLVVSSVAFGATVVNTLFDDNTPVVLEDEPEENPVVLGDEPEENQPPVVTEEPVVEPTPEPTPVPLTLTAELSGTKVVLTWSAYDGADFAYYKVVRSSDEEVAWPTGENDKLIAAIGDQAKLTMTDAAPAGQTLSYGVFAVKSSTEGYSIVGQSVVATVTTPKPTPKPTNSCGMSLSAKVVSAQLAEPNMATSGVQVKLTWTKYHCSHFQYYVVARSTSHATPDFPLPHEGTDAMTEIGDVGSLSWTDNVYPGHTYYYRVMAWNSEAFCNGGTVLAKTNIVKVDIP
jgi:hypothetical protein